MYPDTYRSLETARFCAVALDGPNKTSLAFAEQSYLPKAEGGAYCQELDGHEYAVDSVLIGIEQGKFEALIDSRWISFCPAVLSKRATHQMRSPPSLALSLSLRCRVHKFMLQNGACGRGDIG